LRRWVGFRKSTLAVIGVGLFISVGVSNHFLEEHLWRHVALKHVPRILAWTASVLGFVVAINEDYIGSVPFAIESRFTTLPARGAGQTRTPSRG
jgi:hypothetical protein